MRRLCVCFFVLIVLTPAVSAQYYPPPQLNYYGYPQYTAPTYYYAPNRPMPAYPPTYYYPPPAYYPAPTYVRTQPQTAAQPAVRQAPSSTEITDNTVTVPELPVPPPPQEVPPPSARRGDQPEYTITSIFAGIPYEKAAGGNRLWAQTDYLLWWVRNGPPHFPLVTTDSVPGTPTSGSLASPTAQTLFGPSGFNYHSFSGSRFTLGGWLDTEQRFGVEASGFLFERRVAGFSASSDAAGNPPLYIPAYNQLKNREDSLIVADPVAQIAGSVQIASTLQLWGAEFNGVYHLLRTNRWDAELLAGFRYLDLYEVVELQNTSSGFGATTTLTDRFQTRDQFIGPQVGARFTYTWDRLSAGLSAKFALGATHEVVDIRGNNTQANTTLGGGFFTQPSNIGSTSYNALSAVPQVGGTLAYNLTPRLTLIAGYDFLYWTEVARAGNQIDRTLNLTQSNAFGVNALSNADRPAHLSQRSDFWAQGASLGLQFRY